MIKLQALVITILVFTTNGIHAYAAKPCANLLTGMPVKTESDNTERLIAYLSALLEHHVIGEAELSRIINAAEKGRLLNPINENTTWISSSAMIHWEEIQNFIDLASFDSARILEWARKLSKEKARVEIRRTETRAETKDPYEKIEFNFVPSGTFQMGPRYTARTVKLDHPFEMMSTPVTQKQWVDLMGENPSYFSNGEHTITMTVRGNIIKLQPNNPVEQVTLWSVLEYANRMSIKAGLKPAYDFNGIKFKSGTRAENGTLQAESGEVKINAPDGDIYQAVGFRLPTVAESEYVLRAAGKANETYSFGRNSEDLINYAWYSSNSNNTTHPVAQLKPITVAGKDFFDLHGNVWEWTNDRKPSQSYTDAGEPDAQDGTMEPYRCIRGGSFERDEYTMRSDTREFTADPSKRNGGQGFRLVRTMP